MTLSPESFACHQTQYNDDANCLHHFQQQGITLTGKLLQARRKRQVEFLAGRYCAKKALQQLRSDNHRVGINADQLPRWPTGYVGSISHSSGLAIAAVGATSVFSSIGIDVEKQVSSTAAANLSDAILMPKDQRLNAEQQLPDAFFFTLVFSAKESLYKLLYPEVKRFFGFEAAVMTRLDRQKKSFSLMLTEHLSVNRRAGQLFHGTFSQHQDYIVTLMKLT